MSAISHSWPGPSLEARIAAHVRVWEQSRTADNKPLPERTYPFVTISREFGCEALPVSHHLVAWLNKQCAPAFPWVAYDRELLDEVAKQLHLHRHILEAVDGRRRSEMTELFDTLLNARVDDSVVFRKLAEIIRMLAIHGHAVLVGRGSYWITQDLPAGVHVRLVAPRDWRIQKIARTRSVPVPEAENILQEGEKQRARYLNTFFVHGLDRPFRHDITLDNSRLNAEQMAQVIAALIPIKTGR